MSRLAYIGWSLVLTCLISPFAHAEDDCTGAEAVFEAAKCTEANVVCLDSAGGFFKGMEPDALPEKLAAGRTLTVKVIGSGTAGRIEFETVGHLVHLIRTNKDRDGTNATPPPCNLLLSEAWTAPKDAQTAQVEFRYCPDKADGCGPTHTIDIEYGRYAMEFGLLIPFVLQGDQRVRSAPVPGSDERRLVVDRDVLIKPVIMINVYPFCRPWNATSACGRSETDIFIRERHNWLGIQAGRELAFDDLTQGWYGGLFLSPIAGLGLSGGAALIRAEHLDGGYRVGDLAPADLPKTERTITRLYFGFTVSLEIFDTLRSLAANARKVN